MSELTQANNVSYSGYPYATYISKSLVYTYSSNKYFYTIMCFNDDTVHNVTFTLNWTQ